MSSLQLLTTPLSPSHTMLLVLPGVKLESHYNGKSSGPSQTWRVDVDVVPCYAVLQGTVEHGTRHSVLHS